VLVVHAFNPTIWEAEIGRITFKASPGKQFLRLHLQNNQSKMDWRCDETVDQLLCKHKALSSNPRPIKKQKKGSRIKIIFNVGKSIKFQY
jgi:hypothetical protein